MMPEGAVVAVVDRDRADVEVEFCTGCGYYQKFSEISTVLAEAFPNVNVVANPHPPRMKAFEVSVQGRLVYSKLASGEFPGPDDLIESIHQHLRRRRRRRLLYWALGLSAATAASVAIGAAIARRKRD
ncbi:Selenoprotein F/M domain-containing protein [Plasmodiophora brassicae]